MSVITLGIIGIIIAFIVLIIASIYDLSPLYCGILVSVIVILTCGMPFTKAINEIYLPGVAGFAGPFFGVMLFGAIMGKIYDRSGAANSIAHLLVRVFMKDLEHMSEFRKVASTVLILAFAGAILAFGGVNNIVLMITMYPLAVAVCKETDIPQRYAIGIAVTGSSTFAFTGPFSPQMPNVVAMQTLGTSSYAALVPGIVGAIAELIVMVFVFYILIKRAKANGEKFEYGPNDTIHDLNKKLPSPVIAAIPLIFIFCAFNFFKMDITLAMGIGAALSVLLFTPNLKSYGVLKAVNEGAVASCSSLLFISAIIGFGAVVTKTPSYKAIMDGLLSMSIHPYFQLILCVFAFASISGSTTAGVRLALPALGPIFTGMGYPAGALHRIATFAGSVTDSLPHNGAVIMAVHLSGRTMKQAYPGIFVSTVLATGAGTFAVAIVSMLFPALTN